VSDSPPPHAGAVHLACLHVVTYVWLDPFFDPAAIVKDIIKRPFITVSFSVFCCPP
jgi:sulfoxide reductase heme-binding subunit YedZ